MSELVISKSSPKKILLMEGVHPGAVDALTQAGYEVTAEKGALQAEDLVKKAQGFQAIGIRSKTKLTKEVLEALPKLEVIGCFCIGTDQVNLEEANHLGVPVFNAPYSNTRSVAELIIAEMVSLSRKMAYRSQQLHRGVWEKSAVGSNEVRGKTLGIVGYGHIGSQVSVLAEAMGVNVIYYDILKKLPLGNAKACSSLDDLLGKSDFVSLHVPDTELTQNMIGTKELQKMKQGSYLLNASRGTVVDLDALAEAMSNKHIAGAAIDVYPSEPNKNSEGFKSPIQEIENVILTPHIGGSTEEAQAAIGLEVADSLSKFFRWGATLGAVNFPQVDVGEVRKGRRILNIHKNVPGVLGEVNSVISEEGGNIVAQSLSTENGTGYLVVDIDLPETAPVAERISKLPNSIRTFAL